MRFFLQALHDFVEISEMRSSLREANGAVYRQAQRIKFLESIAQTYVYCEPGDCGEVIQIRIPMAVSRRVITDFSGGRDAGLSAAVDWAGEFVAGSLIEFFEREKKAGRRG